jgi:type II secretory pathway component PulF
MPAFSYRGRNREGAEVTGRIEAGSLDMAASQLSVDGIIPITITAANILHNKTNKSKKGTPKKIKK